VTVHASKRSARRKSGCTGCGSGTQVGVTAQRLSKLILSIYAGEPSLGGAGASCGWRAQDPSGTAGDGPPWRGRVVYLYAERTATVYMLMVFAKNQQAVMTPEERRLVRVLAERLRRE